MEKGLNRRISPVVVHPEVASVVSGKIAYIIIGSVLGAGDSPILGKCLIRG